MEDTQRSQPRSAFRLAPPEPRSIAQLIADGTLDAELAAELWLLIEGRVPFVVAAGPQHAGKTTVLEALLDFLPPAVRVVTLAGEDETFEWLPQASELGWPGQPRRTDDPVRPETTVLLAAELSNHTPAYTWGAAARVAVRATSIGYGLAATIHAESLDELLDVLHRSPVRLTDDELSHLGVALFLRRLDDGRRRIVAAHYLRPIARDVHGHLQRLGPAVLATWDEQTDAFEHFGWGVTPELARRIGMRPGDFEAEMGERAAYLAGLATDDPGNREAVVRALRAWPKRAVRAD